jgi:enamine deaminase RidA (YjgF/YER057c/UK114 family)
MSDIDYRVILPEGWERPRGYSHGISSQGSRRVHIAGQTGTGDEAEDNVPGGSFGAQFGRALERVVQVMTAAGGGAENITAIRLYITDLEAYNSAGAALGEAWKAHMGRNFPAMTLVVVSGLLNPHALVEIEAEGVLS